MAQRDYEEHLGAPAGDRDGLDAGYSPPDRLHLAGGGAAPETPGSMAGLLPGTPVSEPADGLGAERIDRQPGSGGAAGVDGRRDAGPDAWR
ncbi:hypothetical protein [Pseudonocardia sp. DLS-67]